MDILHSYDINFVFITNGMLLNQDVLNKLKKYRYNWLQVSIDGSRPYLHNYVRGVDSFERVITAANLVKLNGFPLVIAHAVVKKNLEYVEEMIDTAYLLGAVRIVAGAFNFTGRAIVNSEELDLMDEERKQLYKIIHKKAKEYAGSMQISIALEDVTSLRINLIAPNSVILIRPNGDIKTDCISPFKIGNVKDQDLKSIWDSLGKYVNCHPKVLEYVSKIKSCKDMLSVFPRVNVDENELLPPIREEDIFGPINLRNYRNPNTVKEVC